MEAALASLSLENYPHATELSIEKVKDYLSDKSPEFVEEIFNEGNYLNYILDESYWVSDEESAESTENPEETQQPAQETQPTQQVEAESTTTPVTPVPVQKTFSHVSEMLKIDIYCANGTSLML